MRNSIKKTVVAAIAALGMAMAVTTISTPAEAQWHGGGFHGGGFHGGWRGGGWGRPGWGGGWGWRRAGWGGGWGGGCWNCGWGWGGGWGWGWDPGWAIAATAVPVGVAIAANASQPVYGDGPGCWARRRVWTAGGHYLGRRLVNICM